MSQARSSFAPAVAFSLVMVGLVALIAWVALGAFSDDFRNGSDGGAHALSKSAVGYAGIVQLLNAAGRPSLVARGPVPKRAPPAGLVVLTIDRGDPRTPLRGLPTTSGFPGPVLAVLPKWIAMPVDKRGWVRNLGLRDIDADTWLGPSTGDEKIALKQASGTQSHLLYLRAPDREPVVLRTGPIRSFQTFASAPGFVPVITDETGAMVAGYIPKTGFVALAEPDLLNNQGISNLETAKAGVALLDSLANKGPIYFDVTLNGFERSRSNLKNLLTPPFLPATLCLLAAALLIVWHAGFRFGAPARPQRELALGKQALADNQAGLIRMARREARMGGRYADLVRLIVGRAIGAPRELSGPDLDAFLDRLGQGGRTDERWSEVRAAAENASNRHDLVAAAERLHRWRLEMTRERN